MATDSLQNGMNDLKLVKLNHRLDLIHDKLETLTEYADYIDHEISRNMDDYINGADFNIGRENNCLSRKYDRNANRMDRLERAADRLQYRIKKREEKYRKFGDDCASL